MTGLIVLLLLAGGAGFAIAHGTFNAAASPAATVTAPPTALPSSTPIPTQPASATTITSGAPPTPSPTGAPAGSESDDVAVKDAVISFGQYFTYAAHSASCSAWTNYATGPALRKVEKACLSNQTTGAHTDVFNESPQLFESITVTGDTATVVTKKDQDILYYPPGCSVPDDTAPCKSAHPLTLRGVSYIATYFLAKFGTNWLVSDYMTT